MSFEKKWSFEFFLKDETREPDSHNFSFLQDVVDKVSAYKVCATVSLDMPELIAVRRLARTTVTITEHAPREYVHVMPGGKENRAVRYIVKMIVREMVCAKLGERVSATKTSQERRAAFRPVRWQTTKYVLETDDVWTVRSLSRLIDRYHSRNISTQKQVNVYATTDTKVPIVL